MAAGDIEQLHWPFAGSLDSLDQMATELGMIFLDRLPFVQRFLALARKVLVRRVLWSSRW